ncbi:MAG: hypothetical protein KC983_00370, partial [Phycisphaerales bacterium]|nr:hypothetical protein [Phycisphaerales bacterium]
MGSAGFWDNQETAQAVISDYKLLKAQTEGLEEVIAQYEDATVGYEMAREGNDRELLEEVDASLHDLTKK